MIPLPSDMPVVSTVLHLLIVEPLPLYTFYGSFVLLLVDINVFLGEWFTTSKDVQLSSTINIGDFVDCLNMDAFYAMYSLETNFTSNCMDFEGLNYNGYFNYGCLFLCVAVAFTQALAVLQHGVLDFTTGGYLAAKWRFEGTRFYCCSASVLLIYSGVTYLILALILADQEMQHDGWWLKFLMAFAMYQLIPVCGLFSSAWALTRSYQPKFDYDDLGFSELRFKRSWSSIFVEGSANHARALECAVLKAAAGQTGELEDMLVDPSQLSEAVRICRATVYSEDTSETEYTELDELAKSIDE